MRHLKPSAAKQSLYPKAPAHLSKEAQAIWSDLNKGWSLDEAARLVLVSGLEAYDRCQQAKAAIDERGVYFEDRFAQLRINPCCCVERDNRAAWLAALKALGLDLEPVRSGPGRPVK